MQGVVNSLKVRHIVMRCNAIGDGEGFKAYQEIRKASAVVDGDVDV